MTNRVHLCIKCGRPIQNVGYCSDCASEVSIGIYNRCTFCGKSSLMSPLAFNKKTKKVYCKTCLNVFVQGLKNNDIPDQHIKKIIDHDFIPVK